MQRQVFDSPAFAQYARQSLVLADVDFPDKHKPDEALRRANAALKARFNLSPAPDEGFPTIVLLNDAGETVFQETGYAGGGPAEFSAGHIPGAVNLDHDSPDFQAKAAALDKSKTHLVHCAAGVRSARACEKLGHLNLPSLYNLPGGFKVWAKAMRIGGDTVI
jgi:hypothetical protein